MTIKLAHISDENPKDDFIYKMDFDTMQDAQIYIERLNAVLAGCHVEIVSTENPRRCKHEVSHN